MDTVWAVIFALAFATWLSMTAYKHSEGWIESAKEWKPSKVVGRYDKWTAKHPNAWQTRLWWAVAGIARQGKRAGEALDKYQKAKRAKDAHDADGTPNEGDQEPGAAAGPDAAGDGWRPPDWPPLPDSEPKEPASDRPAEPNPPPAGNTEPARPTPPIIPAGSAPAALTKPDTPPITSPRTPPSRPPIPGPDATPITPALPEPAAAASGPLDLGPIQEFLGDDMSALKPRGDTSPAAALAGLTRFAAAITGLSQTLAAWKRLVGVARHDAEVTADLTRQAQAVLAHSEMVCARLRATHKVLSLLEDACYRNLLEDGALARVHAAMEANSRALRMQVAAHQAFAHGVAAQHAAHTAQQQSMQRALAAFQYMHRVHGAKRAVELATGARSARDYSTT